MVDEATVHVCRLVLHGQATVRHNKKYLSVGTLIAYCFTAVPCVCVCVHIQHVWYSLIQLYVPTAHMHVAWGVIPPTLHHASH